MSIQTEFSIPEGSSQAVAFTLKDAVRLLFKHAAMLLAVGVVGTLIVVTTNLMIPPNFSVNTKMLINTELNSVPDFFSGVSAARAPGQGLPANRIIETEIELLQSRPIFEAVVRDLGLTYDQVHHPGYVYLLNPVADVWDAAMGVLGFPADPEKRGFKDTVSALQKSISIHQRTSESADTNSNIIEIQLKMTDGAVAKDVLDAIVDEYMGFELEVEKESAYQAQGLLRSQVEGALEAVEKARNELRDYLIATGADSTVSEESSPTRESVADRLRAHLTEMEVELVELQHVYRPDSDNIKDLVRSIELVKKRIGEEVGKKALQESDIARARQKVVMADSVYERLSTKLTETGLYISMLENQIPDRIVIAGAIPPRESSWKKDLVLMCAGILGVWFLSFALVGVREYLDHTFYTHQSVHYHLDLPVLADVPERSPRQLSGQEGMR